MKWNWTWIKYLQRSHCANGRLCQRSERFAEIYSYKTKESKLFDIQGLVREGPPFLKSLKIK
jgi:hypothetical protein